jgi:hypothetical protein
MYIWTLQWVGRLMMIKNTDIGDAADFQKWAESPVTIQLRIFATFCLKPLLKKQNPEMRGIDSLSPHPHLIYIIDIINQPQ